MLTYIAVGLVICFVTAGISAFVRAMFKVHQETKDLEAFNERFPVHRFDPNMGHLGQAPAVCDHNLVEVTTIDAEVVAYLCTKCDEQMDLNHRAAVAHRRWQEKLEARRRADEEFAAMFRGPSARERAVEEQKLRVLGLAVEANIKGLLSDESTRNIVNREV